MASRFYLLKKPRFIDVQKTTLGLNCASKYEINFANGRSNTRFIHSTPESITLPNNTVLKSRVNYIKIGNVFFELKRVDLNKELVVVGKDGVKGKIGIKWFVSDNIEE